MRERCSSFARVSILTERRRFHSKEKNVFNRFKSFNTSKCCYVSYLDGPCVLLYDSLLGGLKEKAFLRAGFKLRSFPGAELDLSR